MNADADLQRRCSTGLQQDVQSGHALDDSEPRTGSALDMIRAGLGSAEQRHDAIAGELLYDTALSLDRRHDFSEEPVQNLQQRRRIQLLRERRKATDVLKQDAHLEPLSGHGNAAAENGCRHIAGDEAAERVLDPLPLLQTAHHFVEGAREKAELVPALNLRTVAQIAS